LAKILESIRNYLNIEYKVCDMADKLPSEDTGTFSIHNSSKDQDIIEYIGWEKVGASKVYTRALQDAKILKQIKEKRKDFYAGRITLGELMQELNQL
jgi:hypothetical protein